MKFILAMALVFGFATETMARSAKSHFCDEWKRSDDGNDRASYRHHCTGKVHKPMSARAKALAKSIHCSQLRSGDGNDRFMYRQQCTGKVRRPMSARAKAVARKHWCDELRRSDDGNDRFMYRQKCR